MVTAHGYVGTYATSLHFTSCHSPSSLSAPRSHEKLRRRLTGTGVGETRREAALCVQSLHDCTLQVLQVERGHARRQEDNCSKSCLFPAPRSSLREPRHPVPLAWLAQQCTVRARPAAPCALAWGQPDRRPHRSLSVQGGAGRPHAPHTSVHAHIYRTTESPRVALQGCPPFSMPQSYT